MVYLHRNDFKSGKQIKEAFKNGEELRVFQPDPMNMRGQGYMADVPDGDAVIEGPHYPQPHRFYVGCVVKDGIVVKIKK